MICKDMRYNLLICFLLDTYQLSRNSIKWMIYSVTFSIREVNLIEELVFYFHSSRVLRNEIFSVASHSLLLIITLKSWYSWTVIEIFLWQSILVRCLDNFLNTNKTLKIQFKYILNAFLSILPKSFIKQSICLCLWQDTFVLNSKSTNIYCVVCRLLFC
jgi:hypothetical protein